MSIQLDDLVARLRLDTSGVGSGLGSLNSSLANAGTQATAAGKRMTLGLTTPIVGIGVASTKLAADFDAVMRQVAIATGGPIESLDKLAKQMGAETAFSAGEAADAMLELAKGGMTAAQIQGGVLAATMKLASAGGIGLAESSTYVSNQLQTFGLKAKNADDVVVALAGAANASSASVDSLGQGLAQGALSARNAGLSLQETTGVLALFDAAGLKGSDAGTSLKAALNSLQPTTEAASGAMKRANLNFVDAQGNFLAVDKIAGQLKRGLGGLSEAQRAQTLETIFGSDGMRAATILMNSGTEGVRKYTAASKDQTTTTKLANAAMEGTSGALERAQGSIETAGLAIGEVLAPQVEKAAAKVEELANRFSEASPETQELIVKGLALVAVVGPLTVGVGVLATSLAKVTSVLNPTTGAMGKLLGPLGEGETRMTRLGTAAKGAAGVGGLVALTVGLKGAADEGASFGDVMSSAAGGAGVGAMFGPVGALVGAAGGAGLAALTGALSDTATEAEAARIELARTAGFDAAKDGADKLREALRGVVDDYGKTTRAAIEASFTGSDGKLQADIAQLRELGVSMDTIVSATLGQADAQKIVNDALGRSIEPYQQKVDATKAALDKMKASTEGVTGATSALAQAKIKPLQDAYDKAKNALDGARASSDVFARRTQQNTGAIVDHRRQVGQLAAQLDLTREQYLRLPKNVRTKVEGDGLPQTSRDALTLIDNYKGLQNFRNIKAIVEASGAQLSTRQIEDLRRQYDLTPKQVKTLVATVGVDAEQRRVKSYNAELNRANRTVTTTVHTQYTYSGLKSPTRGRDDVAASPKRAADKARSDGYDLGAATMQGVTLGVTQKKVAATDALRKAGEEGVEALADSTSDKGGKVEAATRKLVKVFDQIVAEQPDRLEIVGEALTDAFANGIGGGSAKVAAAMQLVFKQLEGVHNAAATTIASNANVQLSALGAQYDAAAAKLVGAQRALDAFTAAREAVEKRQNALAAAGGDITSLDLGTDKDGKPIAPTADGVIGALESVNSAAENFETNLQRLRDAGLSQDALDQLIAKGPEAAGATAAAILAGGEAAITRINLLTNTIAQRGLETQALSSQSMFDVGVAAQQGLISGLESQVSGVEAAMNRIAEAMVKAIRKALKIKSPSRVMMGLGEFTGEGYAIGLDSTTRAVAAASDRVAAAALVAPSVPGAGVVDLAARRAVSRASTPAAAPQVRVFIGDRELTDIVRVELTDAVAPLTTITRQGA